MGFYDGAKIVTSGLVLSLDAADRNSYVSGSTTWNDLSGNGNNGTLTNGPTFSSANGGNIVFDGSNDYIPFNTSSFSFGSSAGTLSIWMSTNNIGGGFRFAISYGNGQDRQARFLGQAGTTYYFGGYGDDITTTHTPQNTWFNMVGVYTGTQALLYINAVLVAGPTNKSWNTVSNNAQLGRQANGAEYWNGNISNAMIYNRALSEAEILQNYNAVKSRFGL